MGEETPPDPVMLSRRRSISRWQALRFFAAPSLFLRFAQDFGSGLWLSMTWLRLLLTRLKFWMHPVCVPCLTKRARTDIMCIEHLLKSCTFVPPFKSHHEPKEVIAARIAWPEEILELSSRRLIGFVQC